MSSLRRVGLALAVCLAACSPAKKTAPRETVHDLVALFPVAEVRREVGGIDFGSFEARAFLDSGWSRNEHDKDGMTFVWSQGEVSTVELFLSAPRDLQAAVRCAPLPTSGPPQAMQVELNSHGLGTVELAPGMHEYVVSLPKAALVAGTNRLAFRYRFVSEPGPDNGHRRLAVQWDALRFRPVRQPAAETPRSEKDALYLPFGSGLVYYLDLPAGEEGDTELSLRQIEVRGSSGGHLEVAAQVEGGEPEVRELGPVDSLDSDTRSRTVELPGRGPRLVRLDLRAVGPAGGLWLAAPVVRSTRSGREERNAAAPRSGPRRPNVIFYLVDTLRADRLGGYGASKPTSPALDTFARTATLFEQAVAQSSWTRPSVTSVLTGLEPLAHGVRTLDDRLAEEAVTLPEMLRAAGYQTAGFSTNPHVSAATGLAQGFDDFELLPDTTRSGAVNPKVLRWLDRKQGSSPFFLYIHTIDPHAPYEPPFDMLQRFAPGVAPLAGTLEEVRRTYGARGEERARQIAQLSALYDAEVAANDRSFGELLAALRQRRLYDSALVVFVADHGEEFDEHGALGHGNNLYAETLDVPLVVKWPGQTEGRRIAHPAQQVDLLPTALASAGLPSPPGLPGTDLAVLAAAPAKARWPARRSAFSHLSYDGSEGVSVVQGDWKLILPLNRKFGPGPELYRRDTDPADRTNLAKSDEVRAGWLLSQIRLEMLRTRGLAAPTAPVDEETRKALNALGYQ
jgi:choline-sulfatase